MAFLSWTDEETRRAVDRALDLCEKHGGTMDRIAQGILVRTYSKGVWLVLQDGSVETVVAPMEEQK